MKTYVISLRRSVDRRQNICRQLESAQIEFEIFDAIDAGECGFLHSEKRNEDKSIKRFGYKLLDSEVACFSSHYEVWKRCVESNEPILVIEDNVTLNKNFFNSYKQLGNYARSHEFVKLFSAFTPKRTELVEKLSDGSALVRHFPRTDGTKGYVISPQGAEKLVKGAKEFIEPVDNYMGKAYKHHVQCVCIEPELIEVDEKFASTIGAKRKKKVKVGVLTKVGIEFFRVYERLRYYI
jgi:glycosyl transferase family 25